MGPDPTRGRGTWGQGVVSDLVVFSRLIAASLVASLFIVGGLALRA